MADKVRFHLLLATVVIGTFACMGRGDRCLDRGGRWNDGVGACEFAPGPLATPGKAITAAKRTLEFAYGPAVLEQEPFLAQLDGDVWHVYGSPEGAGGNVPEVWIDLESGHVQRMAYGQHPAGP